MRGKGWVAGAGRALPFVLSLLVWAGALLSGGKGSDLDREILSAFYLGEGADYLLPWVVVTELGGWKALIPLAGCASVYLFIKCRTRDALLLMGLVLGVRILVEWQKILVGRMRPDYGHLVDVTSLSFPSGHAANALATYLALAIFLLHSRIAVAAAVALSLLIGLSRLFLGVHWPSDVLGGWAWALMCTLAVLRFAPPDPRQPGPGGIRR